MGDETDLTWTLGVLLRAHRERVAAVLADLPHGPRGYQTLVEVSSGRHRSQAALAQHLGIDRTVMTYLLDDLVAAGLVQRQEDPADRRQRRVVVTPRGEEALAALCTEVAAAEEVTLAGLEPDERAVLRRLLVKAARAAPEHDLDACTVVETADQDQPSTSVRS